MGCCLSFQITRTWRIEKVRKIVYSNERDPNPTRLWILNVLDRSQFQIFQRFFSEKGLTAGYCSLCVSVNEGLWRHHTSRTNLCGLKSKPSHGKRIKAIVFQVNFQKPFFFWEKLILIWRHLRLNGSIESIQSCTNTLFYSQNLTILHQTINWKSSF